MTLTAKRVCSAVHIVHSYISDNYSIVSAVPRGHGIVPLRLFLESDLGTASEESVRSRIDWVSNVQAGYCRPSAAVYAIPPSAVRLIPTGWWAVNSAIAR